MRSEFENKHTSKQYTHLVVCFVQGLQNIRVHQSLNQFPIDVGDQVAHPQASRVGGAFLIDRLWCKHLRPEC